MDRRTTPANSRVAAESLRGQVEAPIYVEGTPQRISVPVVDLMTAPDGKRDRQLLLGHAVTVYERLEGWAFVQADYDGFVGYIPETALGDPDPLPTHMVLARSSHAYESPNLKSPDLMALSFGSLLAVTGTEGRFAETAVGWVPLQHLHSLGDALPDPVSIAERFLGTPYLWGGNSGFGLDCSALVQAALRAKHFPCPGDSDLQEAALGETLPDGATHKRGDLLFWKGHVAWVADADRILHANAHTMSTNFEPLRDAIARIEEQGDGPVTRHARLPLSNTE